MIIDAHTHIGSIGEKKTAQKNLNLLLREIKKSGVDHAFILPMYKKPDQCAPTIEETLNVTRGIKNISVLGTIDVLKYRKKDLDELEELLRKKKIIGIKLYPGYQHFYPSDAVCRPIYELCKKYDMPVIFHSGDVFTPCEPTAKVKYTHPLHIDEVATDFPDLKIVIAHLGNPWLVDCAEVLYKNPNVYADVSGLVVEDKQLSGPYGQMMKQRIKELMIYSAPKKLLFGTDWPLATMKTYIKFVKSWGLSKKELDHIFYKNAIDLFKIVVS